ncbi:hypothetical protein GN956_G5493 [Arapaima gigas]
MDHKVKKLIHGRALLLIIALGIGGSFQTGFQVTVISSPSMYIKDFINKTWEERYEQPMGQRPATFLWSSVVGFYALGGFSGALSVKLMTTRYGRKGTMMWNSVISIVAAVFMLTCKTAKSIEMVFISRLLYGFSAGLGSSTHVIYLGESCPKEVRGMVTLTAATFSSVGKFFGQLTGLGELLGREHLWHILLSSCSCFSLVQLLLLLFLPEAPRYLLIDKNNKEMCRKALQTLWGEGDYKVEIEEMLAEQAAIQRERPKSVLELLRDKSVRWQIVTVLVTSISIQFCGISVISVFSFSIFMEAGVPLDKIRYITLGLGLSEISTSVTCSLLIENKGRRALLWRAFWSMSVIMALITLTLNLKDSTNWMPYCTVCLLFLFVIFYGGGAAGVIPPFIHEIFVQSCRPAAFVLLGGLRWLGFSVIGTLFPFLLTSLKSFSFLLCASICLIAGIFFFFLIPETKGKTVLQISKEFKEFPMCGRPSSVKSTTVETRL